MRKPFLLIGLLAAALFGAGYLAGQIGGISAISAAGTHAAQNTGSFWSDRFTRHNGTGRAIPHAAGKVTAINGDTITITPVAGRFGGTATTIVVNPNTTYQAAPGSAATKSSITIGSYVVARGTLSSDGKTLTATSVAVLSSLGGGPGHVRGPHAGGQVTAVTGDTITVKPLVGDHDQASTVTTITVTGSTKFLQGFNTAATKADVKAGVYIKAEGALSSDGKSLAATEVHIFTGAPAPHMGGMRGMFGPNAHGTVTGVSGDSISIKPDSSASTVTTIAVTGNTQYFAGMGAAATKASVKTGTWVAARGTLSSDGKTLTATQLIILPSAPAFGGHGFGGHSFGSHGMWGGDDFNQSTTGGANA